MRLRLDAKLRCADGARATLSDIVLDRQSRQVTHLVVEGPGDVARLVPLELVEEAPALRCTSTELQACEAIRDYAFLQVDDTPQADAQHDIGVESMVTMPTSDAAMYGNYIGELDSGIGIVYDRIPKGDVELRRSSDVFSGDGHRLGHVESVLIAGNAVTHVVSEHRRLWRKRRLAIPIGAVDEIVTDRVTTSLTRDEAAALPGVSRSGDASARSPDRAPAAP
jgi:hypothetical protein